MTMYLKVLCIILSLILAFIFLYIGIYDLLNHIEREESISIVSFFIYGHALWLSFFIFGALFFLLLNSKKWGKYRMIQISKPAFNAAYIVYSLLLVLLNVYLAIDSFNRFAKDKQGLGAYADFMGGVLTTIFGLVITLIVVRQYISSKRKNDAK